MRPRTAGAAKTDPHRIPRFRSALLSRINGGGTDKTAAANAGRDRDEAARSTPGLFTETRRCVVKARYVPMNGYGREAGRLHLKYLERDSVERDGSPGKPYGADDRFDVAQLASPMPGERNQVRFIVSPAGMGPLCPLQHRAAARSRRRPRRRPQRLTRAHRPAVHLARMREIAERILTRQLGLRSELDLGRPHSRDVGAERYTKLDRGLLASSNRTAPCPPVPAVRPGNSAKSWRWCVGAGLVLRDVRTAGRRRALVRGGAGTN